MEPERGIEPLTYALRVLSDETCWNVWNWLSRS